MNSNESMVNLIIEDLFESGSHLGWYNIAEMVEDSYFGHDNGGYIISVRGQYCLYTFYFYRSDDGNFYNLSYVIILQMIANHDNTLISNIKGNYTIRYFREDSSYEEYEKLMMMLEDRLGMMLL